MKRDSISPEAEKGAAEGRLSRLYRLPEFIFAAVLFTSAVVVLLLAVRAGDGILASHHPGIAAFFLIWGLFTISVGYEEPRVGYVSFDRVSQVASILILGPLDAAWVNGLASLIFPWHRARTGVSVDRVITASLNNAGLMALMIFGAGTLYQRLGGPVPVLHLDLSSALLLSLLIVTMQAANELLMGIHIVLRYGWESWKIQPFALALECGAGVTGILVAIVLNRLEAPVVVLLLVVLSAAMLALKQFALMRIQLEAIVEERTEVLLQKTVELDRLATRDQLTGLYNRRYVDEFLAARIEEFHRYGRKFAIALVDLDHFKRINDEHSHEVGDQVLERVAKIFTDRCRDTDIVARYGGEEFLLCFPEADAPTVARVCEELRRTVQSVDWSDIAPGIIVSLSAGVAEVEHGSDRSDLLNAADRRLYQAKRAGRNLVRDGS